MALFACMVMSMLAAILAGNAVAATPEARLVAQRIAPDIYAFIGEGSEASASNRGFAANSGFIVGASGVTVIDTGSTRRHGERMLEVIAGVTRKPVELVINTHAVQEFIFGNAAFQDAGISILAHRETAALMRTRCHHCLEGLRPLLGDELGGTTLVLPQRLINNGAIIHSGGRPLELLHFGWASTPGDIAVFDRTSGTLFAGGLVVSGRVPDIRDCDFDGWLDALEQLKRWPIAQIVPGFGPAGGPEIVAGTERYLRDLDARIRMLYARSTSLLESVEQADLPAYGAWKLYSGLQRRNAQHRFLQLELHDLGGNPRSVAVPER
jgi:glyoxylase-like metal-dependent hydrolase (beta-lactamase superfamily II)